MPRVSFFLVLLFLHFSFILRSGGCFCSVKRPGVSTWVECNGVTDIPSKLFFLFVVVLVYAVTFDQVLKAFEIWVQQYYYEWFLQIFSANTVPAEAHNAALVVTVLVVILLLAFAAVDVSVAPLQWELV